MTLDTAHEIAINAIDRFVARKRLAIADTLRATSADELADILASNHADRLDRAESFLSGLQRRLSGAIYA